MSATDRRVATDDGVDLAVYDFGGRGRDLLLAHATGFHAHVWLPVVDRLRETFHCWAFDERGHGDSTSPPDGNFDWHAFGSDALAVLDELALERPFGAGHSAGGALLLLAEEDRPGTFEALWCYEPVIFPATGPVPEGAAESPLAAGARRRREVFPSKDDAYANYASKPPFQGLAPAALRAYVDFGFEDLPDGTVRLKCRRDDEAATYSMAPYHQAFARLTEVGCPVAVVSGEHRNGPPAVFVDEIAEHLPRATADAMAGLTHFGPLEDPDAVAGHIHRFFTGL